ncbi:MAG: autotransporter outer membrane beta-barrel domain-containing protein [Planctomycetes bacterium]|nr:autotransporter outer membrane beta-barrel domain-containing protein [Planctomycetota bacterium]
MAASSPSASKLTIGDRDWITNSNYLSLGLDGTNTTLRYIDSRAATFFGVLDTGGTGARSTIDVSSAGGGSGNLTLAGAVQGQGDLRVFNADGLASNSTVALNFGTGSYSGQLLLDGARVRVDTVNGIGTGGLQVLTASDLTIGNSITTTAFQNMRLDANLLLHGATGTQQLNWNGNIDTGSSFLTLQQIQLTTSATSSLTGTAGIVLNSGGILSLNGATATQTIVGNGGFLSGPGTVGAIGTGSGFNGTIQLGNGTTAGTLTTTGNASIANAFIESMLYSGSTTADKLAVGGSLNGLNQATVDLIYNASTSGGPLIPANGSPPVNYTVITAGTMPGEVPQSLALSLLDPLNNQYSVMLLDPSNPNTDASGATFQWSTTPGAGGTGVFTITAAPNQAISVPGSTQTNIGSVNNTQLVSAVNQINAINQRPTQTSDAQYVGATLLLLTPQVLPGAIVTAAVAANPDALPNTTFNSMSQAGQVAKLRLMELRDGGIGNAAARANGQDTFQPSDNPDDGDFRTCALDQLSPGGDTAMQPLAVNAGINGASPQDGARVWGRGYGFYENVNGQSYAQGDYSAAMGGVMFGADAALDSGLLAGAFAGFTPGDLSIQSTLGNTQTSLMGLNFGGYASWSPQDGASYVQGYAMAGYNQADQSRNIQIPGLIRTANSTANVWGAMVGGEGGLNLKLGDKAVLQPYMSLDYGYYTRGSYNETGAGSLDLSVSSQDANLLQPMGGARVMQSFEIGRDRLTPYVGAAFVAQLPLGSWSESATNGFSGAQVFSYSEGADNQYGASFQAGLEFATANRWTAYISFNGMAMTDTTVYGGQIGINIPF